MQRSILSAIKYLISLLIAAGLLWLLYRNQDITGMLNQLKNANYSWVILSVILGAVSHLVRAWRWQMLIKPLGFRPKLLPTYVAVMVAYLFNLVLPRMGEVTRCGILYKMQKVPAVQAFGTVITERITDLICLLILFGMVILLAFQRLSDLIQRLTWGYEDKLHPSGSIIIILISVFLVSIFLGIFLYKKLKQSNSFFIQKVRGLIGQVLNGLVSIKKAGKNPAFWISTLLIWVLYFLMTYLMFNALEGTSHLGLLAGFAVLIMGGIGMSAPVQGGIGTFHALVMATLIAYDVQEGTAATFAGLLHISQTIMIIVIGLLGLVISIIYKQENSAHE